MKFSVLKLKISLPGSALILTMFILAGMLIVALGGSYVVILGIRASGIQAQSTKAYFAAEAGAERLLYELRKNSYSYTATSSTTVIFTDILNNGAVYSVYFKDFPPLIFTSVGDYQSTKRSVEVRI
jgi:hypothetical protein